MLDSGASTIFLNSAFVKRHSVKVSTLPKSILLRNADGSPNAIGYITHEARLRMRIGEHEEEVIAAVADTGEDDLIIGVDWLRHHNPEINWATGHVHFSCCPNSCQGEKIVPASAQSVKKVANERKRRQEGSKVASMRLSIAEIEESPEEQGNQQEEEYGLSTR